MKKNYHQAAEIVIETAQPTEKQSILKTKLTKNEQTNKLKTKKRTR